MINLFKNVLILDFLSKNNHDGFNEKICALNSYTANKFTHKVYRATLTNRQNISKLDIHGNRH